MEILRGRSVERDDQNPRQSRLLREGDGYDTAQHAVAYHFQNDFDTLPAIVSTVEEIYAGPVDYARDFMVWNVTKDGVRTRMAVPNPEYYPMAPLQEKRIEGGGERYQTPEWVLDGFPDEVDEVAEQIYSDFNKEYGTDYTFQLK